MLGLALGLGLVELLGVTLSLPLAPKAHPLERLALGWALGLGALTLLMFALSWAGIPLDLPVVAGSALGLTLATWGALSAGRGRSGWPLFGLEAAKLALGPVLAYLTATLVLAALVFSLRTWGSQAIALFAAAAALSVVMPSSPVPELARRLLRRWRSAFRSSPWATAASSVLLLALAALISLSLLFSAWGPVRYWDALAFYDLRGQLFFEQQSIALDPYTRDLLGMAAPLLTSLGHTWVYMLGAGNPSFLYGLYYAALVIGFYFAARERCPKEWALGLTFALGSTPLVFHLSTTALTNLVYAYYVGLGTIYLYRGMASGCASHLWLAGVLLALSLWTREGGEALVVADLAVLGVFLARKRADFASAAAFLTPSLALELPWRLYVWGHWGGTYLAAYAGGVAGGLVPDTASLLTALGGFLGLFWQPQHFGLVWPVVAAVALLNLTRPQKRGYLLALLLINLAATFVLLYSLRLTGPVDWPMILSNSGTRLLVSLVPVALYYVAASGLLPRPTAHQEEAQS